MPEQEQGDPAAANEAVQPQTDPAGQGSTHSNLKYDKDLITDAKPEAEDPPFKNAVYLSHAGEMKTPADTVETLEKEMPGLRFQFFRTESGDNPRVICTVAFLQTCDDHRRAYLRGICQSIGAHVVVT